MKNNKKPCISALDEYQRKRDKKIKKRKRKKEQQQQLTGAKVIRTLASSLKEEQQLPEVVTFSSHRSSKKKVQEGEEETEDSRLKFDMKNARFEVFKLGLNALSKQDRVDAKIALAIKLGAKPPKNPCLPLAELKEKRRREKEEEAELQMENETKLLRKPKPASNKKGGAQNKKGGGGRKDNEMKVGSFDGGTLKISSAQLKQLKSKSKK